MSAFSSSDLVAAIAGNVLNGWLQLLQIFAGCFRQDVNIISCVMCRTRTDSCSLPRLNIVMFEWFVHVFRESFLYNYSLSSRVTYRSCWSCHAMSPLLSTREESHPGPVLAFEAKHFACELPAAWPCFSGTSTAAGSSSFGRSDNVRELGGATHQWVLWLHR